MEGVVWYCIEARCNCADYGALHFQEDYSSDESQIDLIIDHFELDLVVREEKRRKQEKQNAEEDNDEDDEEDIDSYREEETYRLEFHRFGPIDDQFVDMLRGLIDYDHTKHDNYFLYSAEAVRSRLDERRMAAAQPAK